MLTVEGLRSRYGRIEVLHGLDIQVNSGEIVTVVGANGAGKTTLLRCISGIQPVSGGSIMFRGEMIAQIPAYKRIGRGLSQSPEGRQKISASALIFSTTRASTRICRTPLRCSRS